MARRQETVPVPCAEPSCTALTVWAERSGHHRTAGQGRGRLRFAFYGRVSTEDWQDPVTSRARQHAQAESLVRGIGMIVAEFFDIGQSRTVAWARRPQAAALVAALADPDRGWDAIVIGGVRARLLRQPVRGDGPVVRALRGSVVDARGGRPGRFRLQV
jgi:hypothetical protein